MRNSRGSVVELAQRGDSAVAFLGECSPEVLQEPAGVGGERGSSVDLGEAGTKLSRGEVDHLLDLAAVRDGHAAATGPERPGDDDRDLRSLAGRDFRHNMSASGGRVFMNG
jgi:hypothetical protein